MKVTCVGSGDAFGSGGRLNTCYVLEVPEGVFMLDCGATSMVGMRKLGLEPSAVDVIVLSHLHGDHIGGLPFVVRETQIARARTRPLRLIGPPGFIERYETLAEVMFPGMTRAPSPFDLRVEEYGPAQRLGHVQLRTWPVRHTAGTNPHAVRLDFESGSIAYTGDTEWVDALEDVAAGADLLICECFATRPRRGHLDLETLRRRGDVLRSARILLTHLGEDMLAARDEVPFEVAHDGLVLDL